MNRKRETLPDIVRRIPVNSLRPLLKSSLVVAAEVRSVLSHESENTHIACTNVALHLPGKLNERAENLFHVQYQLVGGSVVAYRFDCEDARVQVNQGFAIIFQVEMMPTQLMIDLFYGQTINNTVGSFRTQRML